MKRVLNVLVACEESQAVCKAFRELGHNAYSCDLQECSGGHPEWHLQVDAEQLLKLHWDLVIAHPPCTYMSNAGACRMYPTKGNIDPDRFAKAMDAKAFFMLFYNYGKRGGRIAIENPRPLKCVGLPNETQRIQPYQFGEPWSKLTYLWLFNIPELQATEIVPNYKPYIPSGTSRHKGMKDKYGAPRCGGSSISRSKTFPGIAKAMAKQWSEFILKEDSNE